MEKGLHDGHRERVKEEFLANGFRENTPPHKILEMLLFFCLPRGDTNPLAHQLLNRYKTIAGVLDAPVEELITFNGLTRKNVALLKLVLPVARAYEQSREKDEIYFKSSDEIGAFLKKRFLGLREERFGMLWLNIDGRYCGFSFLSEGDVGSVGISARKVVDIALKNGASCAIMAHNHPRGIALPSRSDVAVTEQVATALKQIDVFLADHYIFANNDYISMAESRNFKEMFRCKTDCEF